MYRRRVAIYDKVTLCFQGMEDRDEEKLISKNVKVIGFQMKVLVSIVKEFPDCLGSCIPQLVVLILTLQR